MAVIIDGKKISEELKERIRRDVARLSIKPKLVVFSAGKNSANTSYIERKKVFAVHVGVILKHVELPTTSTQAAKKKIVSTLKREKPNAAILQIPVSKKLDPQILLAAIPAEIDVDALSPVQKNFMSPVVLSIHEILRRNKINPVGKKVVIVGAGRLVGKPAAEYFTKKKAKVTICTEETKNITRLTKHADIIVSGAGDPHIITPQMLKTGVVALDVGFSLKDGKILGDIDPRVAKKAAVFSGVPGGIGSMTVAFLFANVIKAIKQQNKAKN